MYTEQSGRASLPSSGILYSYIGTDGYITSQGSMQFLQSIPVKKDLFSSGLHYLEKYSHKPCNVGHIYWLVPIAEQRSILFIADLNVCLQKTISRPKSTI